MKDGRGAVPISILDFIDSMQTLNSLTVTYILFVFTILDNQTRTKALLTRPKEIERFVGFYFKYDLVFYHTKI
jgi:hypothetical protein